jgi:hypothetical protein
VSLEEQRQGVWVCTLWGRPWLLWCNSWINHIHINRCQQISISLFTSTLLSPHPQGSEQYRLHSISNWQMKKIYSATQANSAYIKTPATEWMQGIITPAYRLTGTCIHRQPAQSISHLMVIFPVSYHSCSPQQTQRKCFSNTTFNIYIWLPAATKDNQISIFAHHAPWPEMSFSAYFSTFWNCTPLHSPALLTSLLGGLSWLSLWKFPPTLSGYHENRTQPRMWLSELNQMMFF